MKPRLLAISDACISGTFSEPLPYSGSSMQLIGQSSIPAASPLLTRVKSDVASHDDVTSHSHSTTHASMDGLSAAASVVAVIQISAQLFDLCRTYYLNVKDARKDIERLRNEITSLQDILVNVADLANEPSSTSLRTLKLVNEDDGPLTQCHVELAALLDRLSPQDGASKVKLVLRSLKWPLNSKEVDKALLAIGRYKSSFVLALSTDQAFVNILPESGPVSDSFLDS